MLNDYDMAENYCQYYRWAQVHCPSSLGVKPQKGLSDARGGSIGSALMSDEDARHMNRVIRKLSRDYPEEYRAMFLHYCGVYSDITERWKRLSYQEMARRGMCNGNRNRIAALVREAERFLEGYIFANFPEEEDFSEIAI